MAILGPALEKTTQFYTVTLKDEGGVVIPLADLATLKLTYYNVANGAIINSRNDQNVLNANDVTVHATSGLLTWVLQAADTAIINDAQEIELHRALFVWTLTNGYTGKHQENIAVRNVGKVT